MGVSKSPSASPSESPSKSPSPSPSSSPSLSPSASISPSASPSVAYDMAAGYWTVSLYMNVTNFDTDNPFFYCGSDADNYVKMFINTSGQVSVQVYDTAAKVVDNTSTFAITAAVKTHIEVSESGNTWYIFVDGMLKNTVTDASRIGSYTGDALIGYDGTNFFEGYMDEYRISDVCRHTGNFTPPVVAYSTASSVANFRVGSNRPLKGVHFVPGTVNASAATVSGVTWNGSAWAALSISLDGTSTGGATLAKEGTIAFTSTDGVSKPIYLDGYFAYWYWFTFSGIDSATTIVSVTLDAPFQGIKDIWDGTYRGLAEFYKYTGTRADYTMYVYENTYIADDTTTYCDLSSLTATTQYVEAGFTEQITAIFINIPEGYSNSTANTNASVDYWDGSAYVTVGTINDGTAENGISLAKSGVISWSNSSLSLEQKRSIGGGFNLFYYRIKWDQNLDATVRVYYVAGITAPRNIEGYSFGIHAADRLMLGCDNYGEVNKLLISAQNMPDVYNGSDFYELFFGDDRPIMCGAAIFAQYASNIYNMVIVLKEDEAWTLIWSQGTEEILWERYRISPKVGCPAPNTLRVASVAMEKNINTTKVVALWRAHNGIYISNGQAPLCVSNDISDVFDQSSDTHVNQDMVRKEYAFNDADNNEYHWLWASNDSTTLDMEYVLDYVKWDWYKIDRTTGLKLQCGVSCADSYGNQFSYGFIDTGYMERLEYGADFDGESIVSTFRTGEQLFVQSDLMAKTRVTKGNLIAVSKSTETNATVTHYLDGGLTGEAYAVSVLDDNHRIANVIVPIFSDPAVLHSFEFSTTTSRETEGFEPLYFALYYIKERDNL